MEYPQLKNKKCIVFDLDWTLALSKQAIDVEMAKLFSELLKKKLVAIVSGGTVDQMELQDVNRLPPDTFLNNLHLFPTNGSAYYRFDGKEWLEVYKEALLNEEKEKIKQAFTIAQNVASISEIIPTKTFGEVLEDRTTQMTFSALGQQAPLDQKSAWDPDMKKRTAIKNILDPLLPEFSVRIGGATSIDVTRKGIDKAYAIGKICQYLKLSKEDLGFVGDAIFPGGNDYAALQAGVESVKVENVEETKNIIKYIIL